MFLRLIVIVSVLTLLNVLSDLDLCLVSGVLLCVCVVCCVCVLLCLCFFQAEDGIRDLVRSRGLGDVYKRQPILSATGTNKSHTRQGSPGY